MSDAAPELKVLLLEDVPTDAELVQRALRKGGLRFVGRVVDNRAAFRASLAEFAPDIVLSDYNLPDINGLEALGLARAHNPDLPVIEVTGALSDEAATELVRSGAKDFVLKDRLARLPFAVQRALFEARESRARRVAEEALKLSEAKFRSIIETSRDWIWETDREGRFTYSSPRVADLLGYAPEELIGRSYLSLVVDEDLERIQRMFTELTAAGRPFDNQEARMRSKAAAELVFESSGQPFFGEDGALLGWRGASRDITERRRAETEREQYLRFFRLATDAMAIADPIGRFTRVNPAFLALTGYTEAELVAKPFMDFVHPDDRERTAKEMELQVSTRPSMGFENRYLKKDGSIIELSWTAYFDKDEGVTYAAARDVTERNRAVEALKRSEETFRILTETAQDAIIMIDSADRILHWNPAAERILGHPAKRALGRKVHEWLAPDRFREQATKALVTFARSGEGAAVGKTLELAALRADGAEIPIELSLAAARVGDEWRAIGVMRDITERRRAEAAIRASEERFRSIVETSADLIWETDLQGVYTYVSPRIRDWLGYQPEELVGRSMLEILSPEDVAQIGPLIAEMRAHPQPIEHVENVMVSKDGSRRVVVESSGVPILGPDGAALGFRGVDHDITERKKAEQQIRDEEARYRGLVEQEVAGIYIIGADGKMAYINPWFARGLGYAQTDVIGRPFLDFVAEPDREAVRASVAGRLSGEAPTAQYTTRLNRQDGSLIDVLVHSARSTFEGRPCVFGVLIDITEQRKAEAKIRENEARFRALAEQDMAGIYILSADATVGYINPGFAKALGYSADQVIGRPFVEFLSPEFREPNGSAFAELMSGRVAATKQEGALIRADGGRMSVLTHSAATAIDGKPAIIGVLLDLTQQKEAERNLRRLNRTLQTLSAGNEALVRATSEEELLGDMCRILVERGGYRMAWIGVPQNDEARTVKPVASAGDRTNYLDRAVISWSETSENGRGLTGEAIRSGEPQTSQNFASDARTSPWKAQAAAEGYASAAALPLKDDGRVFGMLAIYSGEVDAFNEDELKLLRELAADLSYGVRALRVHAEREAAVQRWRAGLVEMISAIAGTMEMRDPYTAGHQHRVSQIAVAIAKELELPEDQIQGINLAGIIHDIGKITVPSELLTKPGKLTPLEFQLIQTHAQAGYEVVKDVDFPWPIADAIHQHHERLDGTGYPQGLKGDQIIREAKILAVADVVEAMMSHRPYRPARGVDAALSEIETNRGNLYDPAAVDACLKLFREKGFKVE